MTEKVEHTELRKLAEAATPGPWSVSDHEVRTSAFVRAPKFGHVCNAPVSVHNFGDGNSQDPARKNIAFIAAANPETVLALLAERDRLREAGIDAAGALSMLINGDITSGGMTAQIALAKLRAALKDTNQ